MLSNGDFKIKSRRAFHKNQLVTHTVKDVITKVIIVWRTMGEGD